MTDEQRFDQLGCINPSLHTPNLDRLAADGVLFENTYTTNPSCVPARASLMTGQYPSQCGVPTYVTYLPDHEKTFMTRLRDGGYTTAVVGKQHFGPTAIDKGYDYEEIIDPHFAPDNLAEHLGENSWFDYLAANGVSGLNDLAEPLFPFVQRWKADPGFHIDTHIGQQTLRWLREDRPHDKPWFMFSSFSGPHMPFDGLGLPHERWYDDTEIDMPQTTVEDLKNKPPHQMVAHGTTEPGALSDEQIRQARLSSHANVSLIDEQIGRMIDYLKAEDLYDQTLILFISDHGDYLGDFGKLGKSQCLAEVLIRIPLIYKPAGPTAAGVHHSAFVNLVDIAPTCMAAAKLDRPGEWLGRDLADVASNDDRPPAQPDRIYMEVGRIRGLRVGDWKISHYFERDYGELYDLASDPWEKNNLWASPQHFAKRESMRAMLLDEVMRLSPRHKAPWNDQSDPPSPEI
ncbi:putative sulfatase [Algisphaera agarilytica]|uniref:Putative sulfatase n=2 Tax=Algisphaera agarilytica TaxID=1385975 RepID=A0A7X0H4J4_9BACT|nr:putative sulfatase [Algisphaera agarilytica]